MQLADGRHRSGLQAQHELPPCTRPIQSNNNPMPAPRLRAGAGYAGGIVSSAVDGLRVGSAIAAELTGRPAELDAAAFKVKGGY